jgi:hypothetical protein
MATLYSEPLLLVDFVLRRRAVPFVAPLDSDLRFAARFSGLASGLALAVRSAGSAEAPGSRVGPEDRFCEAVRNDLRVPLTLEGPTRIMRGVPAR